MFSTFRNKIGDHITIRSYEDRGIGRLYNWYCGLKMSVHKLFCRHRKLRLTMCYKQSTKYNVSHAHISCGKCHKVFGHVPLGEISGDVVEVGFKSAMWHEHLQQSILNENKEG